MNKLMSIIILYIDSYYDTMSYIDHILHHVIKVSYANVYIYHESQFDK